MAGILEDIGATIKGVGQFTGDVAQSFMPRGPRYRARVRQEESRAGQGEMKQQLAILNGDFSDEEKENAARIIIQAVQPKYYKQRIQQDPNTKFYQPILNRGEQKQKALDPYGRGRSGGTATDPFTQAAVDIGKIQAARGKFNYKDESGKVTSDMTPETAAFFDAAEASVKTKTGFKEPVINPKTGKPKKIFDKSGKVIGTRNIEGTATTPEGRVVDNRELFSEGVSPFETPKAGLPPAKAKEGTPAKQLADYFQTGTETVPEENIPRTFEQIGVETPDAQQTLKEMQDALPDRDLRQEYENDPEGMQRLMKLWKEGKLNKKNIHKAFAALQQKARQSLGIA